MALISVLAVLLLLTLLVVAFMGRATSARIGAANYKATASTRMLADMAVNLVQAQINEATSKTEGTGFAWGCQPGAIRLFDNTGVLNSIFRLYSAPSRTATSVTDLATDLPASANAWTSAPAKWVDLNASSSDANGGLHFPILDPRSPANPAVPLVIPGFSISPAAPVTATQLAPMPTQWLYVLRDGTIIPPDTTNNGTALTFIQAVVQPSVINPIVGRIAYWTDDDSSKVNINTAAGDDVLRTLNGVTNTYPADSIFWSTPMFCSPDEAKLALYQPARGEFQRYSGHPGSVGLNSLLSSLCGLAIPFSSTDFYGLLPRYAAGGSQSSTIPINPNGTGAAAIAPASSRLYTSVAEMLFTAGSARNASQLALDATNPATGVERASFFLTAHSRAPELNLWGEPRISIWPISTLATGQTIEDLLFVFDSSVLTANGKEPYYFQRTDSTSSVTDGAIAANKSVLNYLDTLTSSPIPGFGTSFTTNKYPNAGQQPPKMRQILTEIFDYVRTINMQDPSLTGGHSYGTPFGSGGPGGVSYDGVYQVVPSANNSSASVSAVGTGLNNWGTQGNGAFPVLVEASLQFVAMGLGQQPIVPTPTSGPTSHAEDPIPPNQYLNANLSHDPSIVDDTVKNGALYIDPSIFPVPTLPTGSLGGLPTTNATSMQAFLLLSFVEPALFNGITSPIVCVSVQGLNGITLNGNVSLRFPGVASATTDPLTMLINSGMVGAWNGSACCGYIPFFSTVGYGYANPRILSPSVTIWNDSNGHQMALPFYSQLFCLNGQRPSTLAPSEPSVAGSRIRPGVGPQTFSFSGVTLTITVNDAHLSGQTIPGKTISSYQVVFPGDTFALPAIPTGSQIEPGEVAAFAQNHQLPPSSPTNPNNVYAPNGTIGAFQGWIPIYTTGGGRVMGSGVGDDHPIPASGPATGAGWYNYRPDTDDRWVLDTGTTHGLDIYGIAIDANDTVQSMVLSSAWSDARDLALSTIPSAAFIKHPNYGNGSAMAHNLFVDNYNTVVGNYGNTDAKQWGTLIKNAAYSNNAGSGGATWFRFPVVPPTLSQASGTNGAYTTRGAPGDWDNGLANQTDGPWINKSDEGDLPPVGSNYVPFIPYYTFGNGIGTNQTSTFSPNRMMPSPVMFGSLPTGVDSTTPKAWQTLLFRPGPATANNATVIAHPGERDQPSAGDPADHLLLDLFWMPQCEPYPISEGFSTAGKINLNYEIQPFTYITRATALRALFAGEKIAVMPDLLAGNYKVASDNQGGGGATKALLQTATNQHDINGDSRLPIDPDATLGLSFSGGGGSSGGDAYGSADFSSTKDPHSTTDPQTGTAAWYGSEAKQTRFFKSPSELCEMFLVPLGYTWNEFSGATGLTSHSWYQTPNGDFALVGDNTRERPYANLYSRVTTKSNVFTVYYTVQALKNAQPKTDAAQATWNESTGTVIGELRGSNILERYLDPNEAMPDFQASGNTGVTSLESYYKWRVVETRQFAP